MLPPIGVTPLLDTGMPGRVPRVALAIIMGCSLWQLVLVYLTDGMASGLSGDSNEITHFAGFYGGDLYSALGAGNLPQMAAALVGIVTAGLSHGDWMHLVGNMLFVLAFAPGLEVLLGVIPLIVLFLATNLLAILITISMSPEQILIGASASAYGLAGAYYCLRPTGKLAGLFLIGLPAMALPIPFVLGMRYVAAALVICQVVFKMGTPALVAHLSGFVLGYLFAYLSAKMLKNKERK